MAANDVSYIASGFHEDCNNLMELFKSHSSFSFGAFTKAWKDMKFSLIFLCRKTFAELLEFCEESLNIAKQFVLSPSEFIEQIFGLYLLYGLYYKVPAKNVKIRVTLKEWQTFLNFHKQIKDEQLYDASYIFVKLVIDNAFHHCLFDTEYGLEKVFKARHDHPSDNPFSVLQCIVEDIEIGELAKVKELSKEYEEQKTLLLNTSLKNKLQFSDANFLDGMIDEIETLQEKRHLIVGLKKKFKQTSTFIKTDKIKNGDKIRPKLGHGFDTDSSDDDYDDDNDEDDDDYDDNDYNNHHNNDDGDNDNDDENDDNVDDKVDANDSADN